MQVEGGNGQRGFFCLVLALWVSAIITVLFWIRVSWLEGLLPLEHHMTNEREPQGFEATWEDEGNSGEGRECKERRVSEELLSQQEAFC